MRVGLPHSRRWCYTIMAAVLGASCSGNLLAAGFTPGNLVVDRVGDGTAALNSAATAQFIDEFTTAGTPVSSVAISTTGASALTVSGSATSEGAISLSKDGTMLTLAGYNGAAGTASIASSTGTADPRSYATVNAAGTYSFGSTFGTTAFSANNIRGAVTDGTNAWADGANTGTVITSGTVIQSTSTNNRVENIFNNQLMFSTGSGSNRGVWAFTDLPTGAEVPAVLINMGGAASPYDFVFNSSMTLAYVTDDRASALGGIYRFHFDSGTSTWVQDYILGTGATNIGARGLAVDFSGANPVVYATTAEGSADRLISIVDTGASSSATTLATSGTNEIFRGLEFAPTAAPEPASLAVLALGGVALLARKRK